MSDIKTWQQTKAESDIEMNTEDWMQDEIDELRTEIERLQTEDETREILLTAAQESNQRLTAARDAAQADAQRYCFVLGMSTEMLLRLYNTRFDLRQKFIDAAMKGEQP